MEECRYKECKCFVWGPTQGLLIKLRTSATQGPDSRPQSKLRDLTLWNHWSLLLIFLKQNLWQFILPKTEDMMSLFLYNTCFGSKAKIHIFRHDELFLQFSKAQCGQKRSLFVCVFKFQVRHWCSFLGLNTLWIQQQGRACEQNPPIHFKL